jgi:predicted dehydrogenase
MLRIGMIGADSSHTELYGGLMAAGGPWADRARIVKLWGEDRDQARQKAQQVGIEQVVDHPADAMTGVDGVMICLRYGDDHPAPARLAIGLGVPTFVDKPFVNDLYAARDVVALAADKGVPLMSCSSLRYAVEMQAAQARLADLGETRLVIATGPAAGNFPNPRASHPFFYGVHAAEMLHTLIGAGAESVTTSRTSGADVAVVGYANGRQGVINLLRKATPVYQAQVYAEKGAAAVDIQDHESYYHACLGHILTMFETGQVAVPSTWTLEIISVLTALERSATEGGRTIRLSEL